VAKAASDAEAKAASNADAKVIPVVIPVQESPKVRQVKSDTRPVGKE
jgi:hypothetical protein